MEPSLSKSTSVFSVEAKQSKISKGSNMKRMLSRSFSLRHEPSILDVALERYKNRRRLTCMDETIVQPVQVSTSLQFFREDFGGVSSVRLSPDGSRAVVGFNSGDVRVCRTNPGTRRESMQSVAVMRGWEGNDSVTSVRFAPSDPETVYAASADGSVYRARLQAAGERRPEAEAVVTEANNEIYSLDFSASGRRLVTGGRDGGVRVYDAERHALVDEYADDARASCPTFTLNDFRGHAHRKRVCCVRCHPADAHLIASGGWDGVAKLWDVRCSHGWARDVAGPRLCGEALDVRDGVLLTASYEPRGAIQLWDFGTGGLLQDLVPSNRRVSAVGEYPVAARFFDADTVLCGGLGTGGLQVVGVREAAVRYLFEDDKAVAAVDSVGDKIAFGGKSDSLLVANMSASVDASEKSAYSSQGSRHNTEHSIVSFTEPS